MSTLIDLHIYRRKTIDAMFHFLTNSVYRLFKQLKIFCTLKKIVTIVKLFLKYFHLYRKGHLRLY